MAVKERDVEDVYEKLKEIEEQKEKETLTRVPMTAKTWLSLLFGSLIIFLLLGYIEFKTGILIGIIIVGAIKFIYGDIGLNRELTEQELAISLYKKLRYKQVYPLGDYYQISPHFRIQVEKIGRRIRINGIPQERIFGVSFFDPRTSRKEWYRYAVDLKTGDIAHSKRLPAGFIELEDWDIKVVDSERLRDEKRFYKSLGVSPPRRI